MIRLLNNIMKKGIMKEHILDLIIIESNIDHYKIWDDYFSNKYEIKTFNSLENSLENKKSGQIYLKIDQKCN